MSPFWAAQLVLLLDELQELLADIVAPIAAVEHAYPALVLVK
jgi:hypothetical protein